MTERKEDDLDDLQSQESSFVWDDSSQLYFHARTGFYHDPNAGWYYSSSDGIYYRFENGNYVLWESDKGNECQINSNVGTADDSLILNEQYTNCAENGVSVHRDHSEAESCIGTVLDEHAAGHTECFTNQAHENPPPPSEWLEQTLIDLYLSGYNLPASADENASIPSETDGKSDSEELEEGEWIPDDPHHLVEVSEVYSKDEENWLSQYGQVIPSQEEPVLEVPVIDLWDWAVVTESRKDGKRQVDRLVGRLVKRSTKLHPSVPSGGRLLKTAPICEVRSDLVRVTTGQVYKLRSPSKKYLASLSTYESSNPTKDWDFPVLSVNQKSCHSSKLSKGNKSNTTDEHSGHRDSSFSQDQLYAPEKLMTYEYRDRAAERRTLHGGFGVGPGQKKTTGDTNEQSSPVTNSTDEAAAEALNMSFGAGSYARKVLENMGWKEGEGLGSSTKGLVEPLQAVGNVGSAGLGWPKSYRPTKHR